MASIKDIKNSLTTIVQATQFAGGTAFANVFTHPIESFDGYPNAVILLDDGESEFTTNVDNQRTEVFNISIIVSLEDQGLSMSDAYDRVYDLMDSVKNDLDNSANLNGDVLYMNPASGGVSLAELQNGQNVIGQVRVAVRYLHSIV